MLGPALAEDQAAQVPPPMISFEVRLGADRGEESSRAVRAAVPECHRRVLIISISAVVHRIVGDDDRLAPEEPAERHRWHAPRRGYTTPACVAARRFLT